MASWIQQIFKNTSIPVKNIKKEFREWNWTANKKKGIIKCDFDIFVRGYIKIKKDCYTESIKNSWINFIIDGICVYRYYLNMLSDKTIIGDEWVYIPLFIADVCGVPLFIGKKRIIEWEFPPKGIKKADFMKIKSGSVFLTEYISGIKYDDFELFKKYSKKLLFKNVVQYKTKSIKYNDGNITIKLGGNLKILSLLITDELKDVNNIVLKRKGETIYLWDLGIEKLFKIDFTRLCINGMCGNIIGNGDYELDITFNRAVSKFTTGLWFEVVNEILIGEEGIELKDKIQWKIEEKWNFYKYFADNGDECPGDEKCCILQDNSGDLVKSKCCSQYFLMDFMLKYIDHNGCYWECPHCRGRAFPWNIMRKK